MGLSSGLLGGVEHDAMHRSTHKLADPAVDRTVVTPENCPDADVVVGLHHPLEGRLKDRAVRRPTDEETVAHPRRIDRRDRRDADSVLPLRHKTALPALAQPVHGLVATHNDDSSRQTKRYPPQIIPWSVLIA